MTAKSDKRTKFRRFSDRRTVLLLDIYETLFHHPAGPERDDLLLQAIQANYATDKAVFAFHEGSETDTTTIRAAVGEWNTAHLIVRGNSILFILNGKTVLETFALSEDIPEEGYVLLDGVTGGITYRKVLLTEAP